MFPVNPRRKNQAHKIGYALSLTHLLALEGRRQAWLEDLWSILVQTAQRLGFASIKLTLPDRVWTAECGVDQVRSAECGIRSVDSGALPGHQLSTGPWTVYCGRAGILELRAPAQRADTVRAGDSPPFEILTELLAEGWLKANTAWHNAQPESARLPTPTFRLRFLSVPPGFWNLRFSFRRERLKRES